MTKSFTPKMEATPSQVNTAAAKGLSAAASALLKFIVFGSVTSSVYLVAFGLGVSEGDTVAMEAS